MKQIAALKEFEKWHRANFNIEYGIEPDTIIPESFCKALLYFGKEHKSAAKLVADAYYETDQISGLQFELLKFGLNIFDK